MEDDGATPIPPAALSRSLRSHEELLWHGQPAQGIVFRATDWFLVPMSILWTLVIAYAAVGAWSAPATDDHVVEVLFCLMLTAMAALGVYLLVGRFVVDRIRRRHTWYGVTNRRVIIARDWPRSTVRSLDIATLTDVALDEGFSDVGTVRFGASEDALFYLMGGNESWPWSASAASPRFERIHDARNVYELIAGLRRGSNDSAGNRDRHGFNESHLGPTVLVRVNRDQASASSQRQQADSKAAILSSPKF